MFWKAFVGLLALLSVLLYPEPLFAKGVRELTLTENEIGKIKTSLDYSTVLKFDGRPRNVILGAQDAYKVEFIQNSVTIKPIQPRVKTNLFVFTEQDGFYFNLVPVAQAEADQVVQVRRKRPAENKTTVPAVQEKKRESTPLIRRLVNRRAKHDDLILFLHSIGWPKSKSTVAIGFSLQLSDKAKRKEFRFSPGDYSVKQASKDIMIQDIFIESLVLAPGEISQGIMLLRSTALTPGEPTKIQFNSGDISPKPKGILSISIPRFGPLEKPQRK